MATKSVVQSNGVANNGMTKPPKPTNPTPTDDEYANLPSFMRPLKKAPRRQVDNPLEPKNQVVPQPQIQQEVNPQQFQPNNQMPNQQQYSKNNSKIEPQTQQNTQMPPQRQNQPNLYSNPQNSQSMDSINSKTTPPSLKSSPGSGKNQQTGSTMALLQDQVTNFQPPKFTEPKVENGNGVEKNRVKSTKKKSSKRNERVGAMPKYQVKYLNLRGKAEPIRLLLNFVQEPFEDHRENYLEFAKYKDKFPLPRLPRLIVDGKYEISYTQCILAYLGRKYGLEGETDEEKATCDMLGTQITTYMDQIKSWVYCLMGLTPPERLNELTESIFLPCVQKDYGPIFEKQLEKTNTGYLVGDKLTWIDFYVACFTDYCLTYGPAECMEKFRRLGYHRNAVFALPQIQEHLKNRPDTVY